MLLCAPSGSLPHICHVLVSSLLQAVATPLMVPSGQPGFTLITCQCCDCMTIHVLAASSVEVFMPQQSFVVDRVCCTYRWNTYIHGWQES